MLLSHCFSLKFLFLCICLSIFAHAVVLPKSLGALTDGSVESPAMHPAPTVGRPPVQRGRKPGRRKTKVTGPWSQKGSALGPQSIQPGKALEPIKIPKKRGPKPGSKVGLTWLTDTMRDRPSVTSNGDKPRMLSVL